MKRCEKAVAGASAAVIFIERSSGYFIYKSFVF